MGTKATPEQKAHFKQLFKAMAEQKTNMAIDAKGDIWAIGRWYGMTPHFRKNFGHWSEMILEPWMLPTRIPLKPYVSEKEPTEEDKAWSEFYQRPLKKD